MNINELLSSFGRGDYDRENFDKFLKHVKFKFEIPSIHIAGTNGKGSTANYINNIYIRAGYKTGLFTSPYFDEVNEMIVVNNEKITNENFVNIFKKYEKLFKKFDLSPFEIQTFVAFEYFKEKSCDICVIECGMGGEVDATNIFTPVLSIITSVSLEHTEYLGHTLTEISQQKAGIFKEEVPVLLGEFAEDVMTVLHKEAKLLDCKVHYISKYNHLNFDNGFIFDYSYFREVKIPSFGKYSVIDASFAIEAVSILKDRFPVEEEVIKEALANTSNRLRMEIVSNEPLVILDGAHNPEAAKKTVEAINAIYPNRNIHVVFSCFRDKNLPGLLSHFGSLGTDLTLTTFPHPRARTEDEYFLFLGDYNFTAEPLSFIKNLMIEHPEDVILITGSLAFASYIKRNF